jgi:Zn-dependent peptidase ImmA (M78 family)/DNA-binding XRE family transcriptional regulator
VLNPDRVELVRKRLGLTKIGFAERLGVDRKVIQRFEAGDAELPEHALTNLVSASQYPIEFFSGPSPEYPNPDGVSFRSLRSLTARSRDASQAAGSLAFMFDDWISDRYGRPEANLDLVPMNDQNPAEAAARVRAHWGIGSRPIGNAVNLLETNGIRVFSLAEETRHLDAYSLWRDDKPYIFLNMTKTMERTRHDAFHELGHLVMHRHTGSKHKMAEFEADTFASAFLMPEEDLKAEIPYFRSLDHLIEKKRRWGVSAASLNFALNRINRISDWNYRGNYIALGKIGKSVEPNPLPPETSQIWTKILRDLWTRGLPLSRIAHELHLPEKELNDLLFGIASALNKPQVEQKPHAI